MNKEDKYNFFNPEMSFFTLPLVRWTGGLIIASAIVITGIIIYHSNLRWDFSYLGFNKFLEVFKFPLGVLALLIPIIGVLAINHRSAQTKRQIEQAKRQIEVAKAQNNFQNYYKHLEEFEKFIEKEHAELPKYLKEFNLSVRRIHKYVFDKDTLLVNPDTLIRETQGFLAFTVIQTIPEKIEDLEDNLKGDLNLYERLKNLRILEELKSFDNEKIYS